MAQTQCPSMYTHMGSLTSYADIPALRIAHGYLAALDSLDFEAHDPTIFFADNAAFFDSTNSVYRSSAAIWTGIKSRFGDFEFMHHQTCLTRVLGPDVRSLKNGERHVVSVQAIMLCRLKGWEEERIVEVPRMFEFIVGPVEAPAPAAADTEPDEGVELDAEAEARDVHEDHVDAAPRPAKRGYQGLHIYEGKVWWDSGALTRAIEEKKKEDERRRFRDIMTLNNGFLGQRPRHGR
ncbi:uncharacterized protein BKCO1_5500043 [Diplodia corticola]|uniref:Uncharacterized protein n=1 Tax=Diplodia corticola TaxID=236234 RepID=A0A1J9QPH0_9PEZI|nr:uncharacterized protein BKCO1_5500043 [Diplodia corticola]OJD30822.1 hypothetical protein BKCO1_5500043 [Diplodia corticola]